jgi:hypothetical protein
MVCFPKPGLIEELNIVENEDFSITCYTCDTYTRQRPRLLMKDKPILSSERLLHKNYDRKNSAEKKSLVVSLKGLGPKKI